MFQWHEIARNEIGEKEIVGNQDNQRIIEYIESCTQAGVLHDEIPWCSAFVNWCITRSGYAGTNKLLARSWLEWGTKIPGPVRGCIAVFKRGTQPWSGHVGIVETWDDTNFVILGGNQSNRVCVMLYPMSKLLGLRLV